jgi:hypothetical protein
MMTATEKSKMRIGRGLFRLWLVLSVFWIAAVGTVTWQNWPVDERISPSQPPQASARECENVRQAHLITPWSLIPCLANVGRSCLMRFQMRQRAQIMPYRTPRG